MQHFTTLTSSVFSHWNSLQIPALLATISTGPSILLTAKLNTAWKRAKLTSVSVNILGIYAVLTVVVIQHSEKMQILQLYSVNILGTCKSYSCIQSAYWEHANLTVVFSQHTGNMQILLLYSVKYELAFFCRMIELSNISRFPLNRS